MEARLSPSPTTTTRTIAMDATTLEHKAQKALKLKQKALERKRKDRETAERNRGKMDNEEAKERQRRMEMTFDEYYLCVNNGYDINDLN